MASSELKAVYAEMFPGRDVDSYAELVFRAYDHNRDGFICFEDVARVYSKLTRSSPVEKLSWIFDFYDTHHRGQIGCIEMSAIVKAFYSLRVDKRRQVRPQTIFDHTMSAFQKLIDSKVHYVTKMSFINGCLQDPVIMESLKSWEFRSPLTEALD
ncbi:Kv channel-interacting protein 4-like protein [Aphelenchoides avenae]|nr:Kv channel-interacting protein 4-like protein [Aphelenchus avenae]